MADDADGEGLPLPEENAAAVVEVMQAVANQHRLQLLLGLYRGVPRTELVSAAPISESGVSNHLRRLEESGLVYYAEDGWTVTPLGVFVADWLEDHIDEVVSAVRRVESAEARALEELDDVPLSDQEMNRAIIRRKWELARDDLADLLNVPLEAGDSTGDDLDGADG